MILAADIGDTKARGGLFEPAGDRLRPVAGKTFPGRPHPRLDETVRLFLAEHRHPVERACLAVAWPLSGGRGVATLDGSHPADVAVRQGGAPRAEGDVAMESADVVLMKSDPFDVLDAIALSRATLRKMRQNLFWAVAYNVVAFPAAAGVFYPFVISPEVAAVSMSGSSVLVAVNALLLKRTKLGGTT